MWGIFASVSILVGFDAFDFAKMHGNPLQFMSVHLCQELGLLDCFKFSLETAKDFFGDEHKYKEENPYHNAIHATDVVQAAVFLSLDVESLTPLEKFALIVGAAVHDVEHLALFREI
eukprot:m.122182 g.122182  ORF g.122182 m.122182 type:complete len:117 (+) comp37767_c0_seq20:72-422(+)